MAGVMKRALNSRLSAAWNAWTGAVDDQARLATFGSRMLQRELLKGWNKWYAQLEEYWRLRAIFARMKNVGLARAFDHWLTVQEDKGVIAKRERAHTRVQHLKKLARAWRTWCNTANEAIARGRIRDTFKFSKNTGDEQDLHAEAIDWRASLNRGRTRGGGL